MELCAELNSAAKLPFRRIRSSQKRCYNAYEMFLKKREAEKETFSKLSLAEYLYFCFSFSDRSNTATHKRSRKSTQEQRTRKREKERHKSVRSVRTGARSETNVHGGRTYDSIAPLISTLN